MVCFARRARLGALWSDGEALLLILLLGPSSKVEFVFAAAAAAVDAVDDKGDDVTAAAVAADDAAVAAAAAAAAAARCIQIRLQLMVGENQPIADYAQHQNVPQKLAVIRSQKGQVKLIPPTMLDAASSALTA